MLVDWLAAERERAELNCGCLPYPVERTMTRKHAVILGIVTLALGLAWPLPGCAAPQEVRGHVPAAVARLAPVGRVTGSDRLKLAIGLPLRNAPELGRLLRDLYDPASSRFRQFLTPEQFAAMFGPSEEDYRALITFAKDSGLTVTATHPNRVVLSVTGAAADIERALHLTLRVYNHPTEARTFHAPDVEPSVDLAVRVLHISGLDSYSLPRPMLRARPAGRTPLATPNAGSGPGGAFIGGDFRAAYVPGTSLTGAGQSIGLLQFDGYYASDIAAYESQAGLPNVTLVNVPVDGGVPTPGSGSSEVSLDIEMAISMAPGISKVFVYMAPNPSPWVDLLNSMVTNTQVRQFSCSWGGGSPDSLAEQIFQQMAAQGQSFFNASGDSCAFTSAIEFPSESTNITQVGGTTLTTSGAGGSWVSEIVWNWGIEFGGSYDGVGSSGGISTYYPIPDYQQGVDMTASQGSTSMRNVPDVALTADNVYVVYGNGTTGNFGGTSCAAPLWAGFMALVNQQAALEGRSPIGFINPAVYDIGKGATYSNCFHDTTSGNNTWKQSPSRFYAVPGYDLCTGWGTPTGTNLINALCYRPPATLAVTPSSGVTSTGPAGGPFSPSNKVYALQNTGTNALAWHASKSADWLNLSSSDGALAPGGATNVTVSLQADSLAPGSYSASIGFTNVTTGLGSSTRSVNLTVRPPRVYFFPLDTDPGWTRQGQWAFGHPAGAGGTRYGYHDPGNGATGTNVFGVNLSGDYTTAAGGPYYVIAGPLNFTGYTNVILGFQRWLNTYYPPSVYATVEASSNGTVWTPIFTNKAGVAVTDSAWTNCQYDISAVASNQGNVYVRWGHRIATAGARAYSGWNLDDIEFLGIAAPPTAEFSASPSNGAAPLTVTFTDRSSGFVTNRWWSFGDGGITNTTSTTVAHVYATAGTDTVTLVATGPAGVSTNIKPACIVVSAAPPLFLVTVGTSYATAIPGTTNVSYGTILNETVVPRAVTTTPGRVRVRVADVKISGNDAVVTP